MNKTIGRYMRNAKELGNGKPAIQDNLKVSTPFALPLPVLIFAIIAILMEAFHDKLLSVSKVWVRNNYNDLAHLVSSFIDRVKSHIGI